MRWEDAGSAGKVSMTLNAVLAQGHVCQRASPGFADAVQAIMSLPLSDAEKAEAVRRLLAGR